MYRHFLSENKIPLTPIAQLKIDELDEADALCYKCELEPIDVLMCSGIRPYMDNEATKQYNTLKISQGLCSKRMHLFAGQQKALRLQKTYVPADQITKCEHSSRNVALLDGHIFVDNTPLPKFLYAYNSVELTQLLWELAVKAAVAGIKAKYIYPVFWYRFFKDWHNLNQEFIGDADWLIVESPDISSGPDYRRQLVFDTLSQRIAAGLPTFITISKDRFLKNESEKEFFDMVQKWERFEL